jgi:hypothetical protein
MATYFQAVNNVPSIMNLSCATGLTVSKGVPVVMSSGVVTIAASNSAVILGIAAETHAAAGANTIAVLPAIGSAGPTIFKIPCTTLTNQTSCGASYELTMATNNVSITTTASGPFFAITADGTTAYGYLAGTAIEQ